ncbi:hypothetical protein [Veronia pacifica]|uniref:Uncharacterized protein n=1 Tax=Veronia pacifica TaxID=1080227 RepID=A0A1C3E7Y7_9GAMM|nr:hypothetical protein [Veronia pacifica]ODA29343.1 hypothetical protein A8L45_22365 [Veronia pacifica]
MNIGAAVNSAGAAAGAVSALGGAATTVGAAAALAMCSPGAAGAILGGGSALTGVASVAAGGGAGIGSIAVQMLKPVMNEVIDFGKEAIIDIGKKALEKIGDAFGCGKKPNSGVCNGNGYQVPSFNYPIYGTCPPPAYFFPQPPITSYPLVSGSGMGGFTQYPFLS